MRALSLLASAALLVGPVVSAAGQQGEKTSIKVEKSWSGRLLGKDKEALRALAPPTGFVSDAKAFATLWKAWRTEDKVPDIDFGKKLVLVATAKGPNEVKLMPQRDAKGDLSAKAEATLIGGPGFGYVLAVIDRDGIKSVQGISLEKAK